MWDETDCTDRFEIISTLGTGKSGVVYRVKDKQNEDIELALKVLTDSNAFDALTTTRFQQEAKKIVQ